MDNGTTEGTNKSILFPDYGETRLPLHLDVAVPVSQRGCYKNSIELHHLFEWEEPPKKLEVEQIKFPEFSMEVFDQKELFETFQAPVVEGFKAEGNFDLETDAKERLASVKTFSEVDRRIYRSLLNSKTRIFSGEQRLDSLRRYRCKKTTRKMTYQIRYKVRQDLAVKRMRNKGKFIKSKKFDIRAVADMIMRNEEEGIIKTCAESFK